MNIKNNKLSELKWHNYEGEEIDDMYCDKNPTKKYYIIRDQDNRWWGGTYTAEEVLSFLDTRKDCLMNDYHLVEGFDTEEEALQELQENILEEEEQND